MDQTTRKTTENIKRDLIQTKRHMIIVMCNIFHCKSCHHLKVYGRPLFFPCLTQTSYNYFYITALEKINATGAPVVLWIALFRQSNAIITHLMSIASFIIATHGKRVLDTTQPQCGKKSSLLW